MPTIRNRGPYQYQAVVRKVGHKSVRKTFETEKEAMAWAIRTEEKMDRGAHVDRSALKTMTLGDLLRRYLDEVTPTKRGWRPEASRMRALIAHPLAARRLATLQAADFAYYRDTRLKEGASNKTVLEGLRLLSATLNTARKEWSLPVENWVEGIRKPAQAEGRDRRLRGDEETRLLAACRESKSLGLECAVVLAIETGMRRGEIADLEWRRIDLDAKIVTLDLTKNGSRRIVPLSVRAEEALRSLPRNEGDKVFSFFDSNGLGAAFVRACERAEIEGLHFHDLRHEAASRLAHRMQAPTLAKIMGWKTLQIAMRYYNPTGAELVQIVRGERKEPDSKITVQAAKSPVRLVSSR